MNISDLGNELIGLEYSIRTILKKLKYAHIKEAQNNPEMKELLNEIDLTTIEILTEGFVDNCFLKKIKFKDLFDEMEKRPELMKLTRTLLRSSFTLYGAIAMAQIAVEVPVLRNALEKGIVPKEFVQSIQESQIPSTSKSVAFEIIKNQRFRDEFAKTICPLRSDTDCLELKSESFVGIDDNTIKIDVTNKESFLGSCDEDLVDEEFKEDFNKINGRISSIRLDATKNQIGFKVENEGSEIECSLTDTLDIYDYIDYLNQWIEIEGLVQYSYDKTEHIEIHNIKKINSPEDPGQTSIDGMKIEEDL